MYYQQNADVTAKMLTADSLNYPDEIFNFFVEQGITNMGFNMEETEGVRDHSSAVGMHEPTVGKHNDLAPLR